jgi:hypothetical protein
MYCDALSFQRRRFAAKSKLAYFKDNIATDEDDFDASQYYYNRHGSAGKRAVYLTVTLRALLVHWWACAAHLQYMFSRERWGESVVPTTLAAKQNSTSN